MERTDGGRLRSADVFKGLAIFFIAVLHLAIAARAGMDAPAPAVQALYLGLMGFFIMSGYFLAPGRGFKGSMRRRCKSILLALIAAATVLSLASFAWCCLWEDSVSPLSPQYAGWMSGMFPFCPHNKRAVRNPISIVSCVRKMPFSNTTWHHLHTPRSAVP